MRAAAVILLISVSGFAPAKPLTGNWGGQHISLQLTPKGGAVEWDCAHGELSGPVTLDKQGRFDIRGTYEPEHGGPVRSNEISNAEKVRYSGRVTGDRMTLTVTRAGAKARLGNFALERGKEPMLMKCR